MRIDYSFFFFHRIGVIFLVTPLNRYFISFNREGVKTENGQFCRVLAVFYGAYATVKIYLIRSILMV